MKRIITCSDGTWNKPNTIKDGLKIRTNVHKIFNLIRKSDDTGTVQIKYYDAGVGASGNLMTRFFDGATGRGIDQNIQDVYQFIAWNYEPGDEIYLFGFSRGAYTARSLGGMIRKCGIVKGNDLNLLKEAYALYRNKKAGPNSDFATKFRKANCYEVSKIKLIGVWDTVGALGIPLSVFQWYNKSRYTFYDTTLSKIVEHAYHAISIDERRKTFEPALWEVSDSVAKDVHQTLEQVWFAGVHSNVGGGYPDEGLSDFALDWMMQKAKSTGLSLDDVQAEEDVRPNPKGALYNSLKGIFSFGRSGMRTINVGTLHESVCERVRLVPGYEPRNINGECGKVE